MRIYLFRGCFTLLLLGAIFSSSFAQGCKDSEDYNGQNYKIRRIEISTPLGWLFGSVDEEIRALINDPAMPVKAGDTFNSNQAAQGYTWLKARFPELKVSHDSRVAVRFGGNTIAQCDDGTKSLDVVYKLYEFRPAYYYTRTFEIGAERALRRQGLETDSTKKLAKYLIQPYVGYNATRKLYAGTKLTANLSNSTANKIEIDTSGSANSSEVKFAVVGTDNYQKGFFRYSEWRLAYRFSSIPADSSRLRQGDGSGQFYLATRAFTKNELLLRFGGSLESGNRQTNNLSTITLPSDLPNSSVTNVKGFVGATMKIGLHSLKGSYGLQFGGATGGQKIDFIKQVVDSAVTLSFPRLRNLSVDGQFTAGTIRTRGNLPLVEKFYGGNADQFFIDGSAWQIRANPFIRSFPQNELSQVDGSGILGLDSFASFNLTVAVRVWQRRLVPRDVWEDPEHPGQFQPKLDKAIKDQFRSAESQIMSSYLSQSSEYKDVVKPVIEMGPLVVGLKCLLRGQSVAGSPCTAPGIPDSDPAVRDQLEKLFIPPVGDARVGSGAFDRVETSVTAIIEDEAKEVSDPDIIRQMVIDEPPDEEDPDDESRLSQIHALSKNLTALEGLLPEPAATDIKTLRTRLESKAVETAAKFDVMDRSSAAVVAKQQAVKDLQYPRRILDYLIREANLYALSPVLIFDAAHLKQRGIDRSDFRYGVGGGLKFTFLGLDVTGGYVFNPNPRVQEGRGAFLFKFDVSDLFK